MKMTNIKMKNILIDRLQRSNWTIEYDNKSEQLRIEDKETNLGMTISVPSIVSKWEERKEKAIDEIVYYVEEALKAMAEKQKLAGKENHIFPVIRSASFPIETKDGKKLIYEDHTAETRVYYALDLGTTYRLIDVPFAEQEGWKEEQVKQVARFNIRSLGSTCKEDEVAGNKFYFINTNDGYDASRILNDSFLKEMASRIKGEMIVAIPHQDVLIIGDIQNETGYDVVAQMTMSFFSNGHVPITALSFLYKEGELEPIFIMGKNRKF